MRTILRHYLMVWLFCLGLLTPGFGEEIVMVDFGIPFSEHLAPNTVIVPFSLEGGIVLIDARIDDMMGKFIFDTGANGLVLNTNYVRPDQQMAGINGLGISGEMEEVGLKKMASFGLEELIFTGIIAQTVDMRHLEETKKMRILGLIGYELLKDFEIMINYQENYLTLSRVDREGNMLDALPHTLDKVDSIDFTLANFIPVIEVQVAGKTKRMGIDSGAEYNLLDIKRSKDILGQFKVLKKIKVVAANDKEVELLGGKLYGLSLLERYRNPGMYSVLTNFREMDKIYQTRLDGILGYPFLVRWRISLNYKKRKLYFHELKFVRP